MISGKKIKMKVKKSKKDKQVSNQMCLFVVYRLFVWFFFFTCLMCALFSYSETKIEQSFWSSWTLPCNPAVNTGPVCQAQTPQQISGKNKSRVFWEGKDDCKLSCHREAAATLPECRRRYFCGQNKKQSHRRLMMYAVLLLSSWVSSSVVHQMEIKLLTCLWLLRFARSLSSLSKKELPN